MSDEIGEFDETSCSWGGGGGMGFSLTIGDKTIRIKSVFIMFIETHLKLLYFSPILTCITVQTITE